MTKLTLSADRALVIKAKKYAARQNTSLSSLFDRLLRAAVDQETQTPPIGPITARATGLIKSRSKKTDRQVLEDALIEKYRL